jgi:hypothetical protein
MAGDLVAGFRIALLAKYFLVFPGRNRAHVEDRRSVDPAHQVKGRQACFGIFQISSIRATRSLALSPSGKNCA